MLPSSCPDCGYDLRGCADTGHCPECGLRVDLTGARFRARDRYTLRGTLPIWITIGLFAIIAAGAFIVWHDDFTDMDWSVINTMTILITLAVVLALPFVLRVMLRSGMVDDWPLELRFDADGLRIYNTKDDRVQEHWPWRFIPVVKVRKGAAGAPSLQFGERRALGTFTATTWYEIDCSMQQAKYIRDAIARSVDAIVWEKIKPPVVDEVDMPPKIDESAAS